MGVGVDAVWSIELEFELNSPSPDPAPPRGDASSERRREERPTVLDRVAARGSVWSGLYSIDLKSSYSFICYTPILHLITDINSPWEETASPTILSVILSVDLKNPALAF